MHFPPGMFFAVLFLLFSTSSASIDTTSESASPHQLAPCLVLLCMDTGGCTATGPKPNFNGNYFNIKQQTFAKCTYETEGQLDVVERERARRMGWKELEETIEKCQRNFTCGSACIYNYYFTIWERCPRTDMRSGRAFSECEKMAFGYFDQNGWCDEKEHIWEKVRRELPAIAAGGHRRGSAPEESAEGDLEEEEGQRGRGQGRPTMERGQRPTSEKKTEESLSSLFESGNFNGAQNGKQKDGQIGREAHLGGGGEEQRNDAGQTMARGQFELMDHIGDLEELAQEMGLAFEVRRAEHSFVLGEKDDHGRIEERGARLVLTDNGEQLELTKVAQAAGKKQMSRRNFLDKSDWPSMRNTIRGICIGLFQN